MELRKWRYTLIDRQSKNCLLFCPKNVVKDFTMYSKTQPCVRLYSFIQPLIDASQDVAQSISPQASDLVNKPKGSDSLPSQVKTPINTATPTNEVWDVFVFATPVSFICSSLPKPHILLVKEGVPSFNSC